MSMPIRTTVPAEGQAGATSANHASVVDAAVAEGSRSSNGGSGAKAPPSKPSHGAEPTHDGRRKDTIGGRDSASSAADPPVVKTNGEDHINGKRHHNHHHKHQAADTADAPTGAGGAKVAHGATNANGAKSAVKPEAVKSF